MNFSEDQSKQLVEIKKSEEEGFKVVEIDAIDQENAQINMFDTELDNMLRNMRSQRITRIAKVAKRDIGQRILLNTI